MTSAREPNPLVDQIRKGGVPLDVRMMAAEGALPLKPEDMVDLLEIMRRDTAAEVSAAATQTFLGMAADALQPLLKAKDASIAVLSWTLEIRTEARLLDACLQNNITPDEVIARYAAKFAEAQAELVVINQTRLLRHHPLLEALEANPNLSRDQRRRLVELRETFSIGVEPQPEPAAPPPAAAPAAAPEPPAEKAPQAEAPVETQPEAAATPATEGALEENAVEVSVEQATELLSEEEKKDEKKLSGIQRLFSLRTGQKIKAALTEDAQTRTFLIRDPNRLVALAVLGSPKVTEAEIEGFAAMKNVSNEVLRKIGTNKDWTKKYTVIQSLVKNPRTPLPIAMGFVNRLQPRDIKGLTVDRNVPEAIRKAAQRFVKANLQGGTKE